MSTINSNVKNVAKYIVQNNKKIKVSKFVYDKIVYINVDDYINKFVIEGCKKIVSMELIKDYNIITAYSYHNYVNHNYKYPYQFIIIYDPTKEYSNYKRSRLMLAVGYYKDGEIEHTGNNIYLVYCNDDKKILSSIIVSSFNEHRKLINKKKIKPRYYIHDKNIDDRYQTDNETDNENSIDQQCDM